MLREIQQIADSGDAIKRARGRRGLEMLNRIQRNGKIEVRIHDGDFPDEKEVDAKLVRLARNLNAKLFTNDYNLGKIAELQKVNCVNLHEVWPNASRSSSCPAKSSSLKIVREGKDKGQGIGYLPDGTMVVVNNGQPLIGQQVEVEVQTLLQTGAGIIVFADLRTASVPNTETTVHRQMNLKNRHSRLTCRGDDQTEARTPTKLIWILPPFSPPSIPPTRNWSVRGWKRRVFILSPVRKFRLDMRGYALAAGGILVQVPEAEAADAREFLNAP